MLRAESRKRITGSDDHSYCLNPWLCKHPHHGTPWDCCLGQEWGQLAKRWQKLSSCFHRNRVKKWKRFGNMQLRQRLQKLLNNSWRDRTVVKKIEWARKEWSDFVTRDGHFASKAGMKNIISFSIDHNAVSSPTLQSRGHTDSQLE